LAALQMAGVPAAQCVSPPTDAMQFDSAGLWAQLRGESWTGREVLILRGNGGRDEFADLLRAAGAAVHFTQAYERGAARFDASQRALLDAAIADPASHLWWLSSTEAIDVLVRLAPGVDWRSSQALASHPRIARRARERGFGRVFEAPPTFEAVQAALLEVERCLQSSAP
jgi:uroporphyrinogen-III synthase